MQLQRVPGPRGAPGQRGAGVEVPGAHELVGEVPTVEPAALREPGGVLRERRGLSRVWSRPPGGTTPALLLLLLLLAAAAGAVLLGGAAAAAPARQHGKAAEEAALELLEPSGGEKLAKYTFAGEIS